MDMKHLASADEMESIRKTLEQAKVRKIIFQEPRPAVVGLEQELEFWRSLPNVEILVENE